MRGQEEPAGHGEHWDTPPSEYQPGLHTLSVGSMTPSHAYPAGQRVHAMALPLLYVPAEQGVGTAPGSRHDEPAGQSVQFKKPPRA